jgi:hypothetical protein
VNEWEGLAQSVLERETIEETSRDWFVLGRIAMTRYDRRAMMMKRGENGSDERVYKPRRRRLLKKAFLIDRLVRFVFSSVVILISRIVWCLPFPFSRTDSPR